MPAPQELINQITSLDGKGYKSYKILQGKSSDFGLFDLTFEHIQGDPFAAPSRLSIKIELQSAGFAKTHYENPLRKLALEDPLWIDRAHPRTHRDRCALCRAPC